MKELIRCKDCKHWKSSKIRPNYCEVFDWCSDSDDGCTFESEDSEELDTSKELSRLRDDLYIHCQISFRGLAKLDRLIKRMVQNEN